VTAAIMRGGTRTAHPVTVSLRSNALGRTGTPVTVSLGSALSLGQPESIFSQLGVGSTFTMLGLRTTINRQNPKEVP
jgi:hypothetical protein